MRITEIRFLDTKKVTCDLHPINQVFCSRISRNEAGSDFFEFVV